MWSEVNTIGNSKDLLSKLCVLKDKFDKQTHALETAPKCMNSPPRRQVHGKMIMQIMLKKDDVLPVDFFLAAVQVCLRSLLLVF